MKSKSKPIVLLTLFLAISLSSIINNKFGRDLLRNDNENNDKTYDDKDPGLKSAAYFPLTSTIHIDDLDPNLNWGKTAADNDWCNGSGTWNDPYIIEDIVINGQEKDSCILIENSNIAFFRIENCTLYNSGDEYLYSEEAGIKLFNTSNGFLTNNNCSRNNIYGIILRESSNITLSANFANKNANGIVFQDTCINNTIIGNEIKYNFYNGLILDWGCEFNNIIQNNVNDNFESGILLMGGINNTISENILDNNHNYGILIHDILYTNVTKNKLTKCGIGIEGVMDLPTNVIGTDNEVNGRSFYFYFNQTGLNNNNFTSAGLPGQIILILCNDSIISGNFNLSQTSIGISLFDCDNNTISNINANDCNQAGIQLRFSDNNNITDNIVNGNYFGIKVHTCNDTIINRNNATYNSRGIQLDSSFFTLINNNNASYNEDSGISLADSVYNNITENSAGNNGNVGIHLASSSGFNLISNNSLNKNLNPFQYSLGIGIWVQDSTIYNLTITNNILSNNSYAGIVLGGKNHTLSGNNFTNCGLHFTNNIYAPSIEGFNSHNIDVTNLVNKKILYYYKNDLNLDSNNFSDAGQIILVNCNNSQIVSINITRTTVAVSQYYCKNNIISYNKFTFNAHSGILLVKCHNFIITNNNLSKNLNFYADESTYFGFGYGISMQDCYNITVFLNNISSNGMGIAISDSYENQIIDNNLYDNHIAGIIIMPIMGSCDNNNLSGNLMRNCGIWTYFNFGVSTLYIDKTNLVNEKPVYYYQNLDNLIAANFTNPGQIILSGCNNSVIPNFDFSECSVGVSLLFCNNITMYNVSLSKNIYGLMSLASYNCQIMNNTATENLFGIFDAMGYNNTIANNIAENNTQSMVGGIAYGGGIGSVSNPVSGYGNNISDNVMTNNANGLAIGGKFNIISGNIINDNNHHGILMDLNGLGCSNSTFTRNTIRNNEIGISLIELGYGSIYNDNNSFFYNNFIGNELNAKDSGVNNKWDDGVIGNYWDDYSGIDNNYTGIGMTPYSIHGVVYNKDNHPLIYRTDVDTDGEGLINCEEYILGLDNYRTNITNPDSDYDVLTDYWEWRNSTDPWNPDTDSDRMPDGWEAFNALAPLVDDAMDDPDIDYLENYYEMTNETDPWNPDTDSDTFLDGIETGSLYPWRTDPLDKWWYPMPNLAIVYFTGTEIEIGRPFVLSFNITNNGIWDVEDVIIIIRVDLLDIIIYNNSDNPIDLDVDQVYERNIQINAGPELATTTGQLVLHMWLDPDEWEGGDWSADDGLINETYSAKDGSKRVRPEEDNYKDATLTLTGGLPGGGDGFDPILLVSIIIGVVAVAGTISSFAILRPRIKRRAAFKRQIETAKDDIDNFESNIRSFVKTKLKDTYESIWWEEGIPEYIRNIVVSKIRVEKPKKLDLRTDPMNSLDFTHLNSVITDNNNWEQTFSETFPDKNVISENIERLRLFNRNLEEGNITPEDFTLYPLYINAIRTHFTRGYNVFLSYSTLDSDNFKIREIARRLQSYPKIDKVFFWETDSGESIVGYMERVLRLSKVFVFFCSEHSIKSKAVEDEWQAAFQMRKKGLMKIVPVYEKEDLIPFLLMPLLNVKFDKDDFDGFIQKLYEEILRQ